MLYFPVRLTGSSEIFLEGQERTDIQGHDTDREISTHIRTVAYSERPVSLKIINALQRLFQYSYSKMQGNRGNQNMALEVHQRFTCLAP